jgi:hypothetical protein
VVLEAIFNDIAYAFRSTFFSGDWRTIAIALGATMIAALIMSRRGQLASVTLLALLMFGAGGLLRGFFRPSEGVAQGERAAAVLKNGVTRLMDMQAGLLIAYFLVFMIAVLALFGLKTAMGRGGGGH